MARSLLKKINLQPLDRLALGLIFGLSLLLLLLIIGGDRTRPMVRDFSWDARRVGAEDTAFTLTFTRPMDWQSVVAGLSIAPPLPGKESWSGRRFAYTLTEPIPYGQQFQLQLTQGTGIRGGSLAPFTRTFQSRDLAFAYLGVNGEEAERLILYNVTRDQKTVLTPENLAVLNFKPYPQGDRLLFTAISRDRQTSGTDASLYHVTTGMGSTPAGRVELMLDGKDEQILKFDLSADGDRIVVQRAPRQATSDSALWQIHRGGSPQKLKTGGGDFLIAPDSNTLVLAQGQGLALIALDEAELGQPLDFLPQFGMVLSFARDSSAAAMVKFNPDFTRSLFLVTNQGTQKELLRTKGSILSAHFTPNRDQLYCLLTELLPGEDYQELPYIAKIDLKSGQKTKIMQLSGQREIKLSLAPDVSQLLFDQTLAPRPGAETGLVASNVWSLPLTAPLSPENQRIYATGAAPQWLP